MISGYIAQDRPKKYEKIVSMWFQVLFYSLFITGVFIFLGIYKNPSIKQLLMCALPITFKQYWYFTAYFALFFVTPILNKYLFSLDEISSKKVLLILVGLFSCLGVIYDPFESKWGYSAIWILVLYCIGVLAKRGNIFSKKKSLSLIMLWILCVISTWAVHVIIGTERLTNYISPTILLSGLLMVILFSRLKLKGTIIKRFSLLTFGIYLFQLNVVWNILIKDAFTFVVDENIFIGVLYIFGFASMIFVSGLVVEWIRVKLAIILKIDELSKKIAFIIDALLGKAVALLN